MKTLLRIGISAGLLGWLALRTEWDKVGQSFANLQIGWWIAAVVLLLACQLVSAKRWHLLATNLRFQRSWKQLTGVYFIGMYFNMVLPTSVGGDVVRAYYLNGGSGRRMAAFVSVFLDRFTGLLVLLSLAVVAVIVSPLQLPQWVPWFVYLAAGCGFVGFLLLPIVSRIGNPHSLHVKKIQATWNALRSPRVLLGAFALSVVVQSTSVAICWMIGRSIGADVPFSYYWILVPVVSLLTMLPISVNGMGLREWGTTFMLVPLGVDAGVALSLAILWFAVFVASGLLSSFVYLFATFPKPNTPSAENESDDGSVDHHSDQGRAGKPIQAA